MKLLADFRARVLSAKVKKAATEEEGEIDEAPTEQPSAATENEPAASNEDWSVSYSLPDYSMLCCCYTGWAIV